MKSHTFVIDVPSLKGHDVCDANVRKLWPFNFAVCRTNSKQIRNITEQYYLTLNLHVHPCHWDSIRVMWNSL